jgi:probable rRNA maturation factor
MIEMSPIAAADDPSLTLDVIVESSLWEDQPEAETVIRETITVAAKSTARAAAEIAILLTDDSAIRKINRQWRDQDKPTNVLSFPANEAGLEAGHLGDIVIAYETLAREAAAENKPFAHHLAHLTIHGYLHLLGYDHMSDTDAVQMEKLETALLEKLGIPDPYAHAEPEDLN